MFDDEFIDNLWLKIWKDVQGSYLKRESLVNNLMWKHGYSLVEWNKLIDEVVVFEYRLPSRVFDRNSEESRDDYGEWYKTI